MLKRDSPQAGDCKAKPKARGRGSSGSAELSTRRNVGTAVAEGRPPKKRTKTGCLTCRKRRVKCDEQKPACANCVKSKRHCELSKLPQRLANNHSESKLSLAPQSSLHTLHIVPTEDLQHVYSPESGPSYRINGFNFDTSQDVPSGNTFQFTQHQDPLPFVSGQSSLAWSHAFRPSHPRSQSSPLQSLNSTVCRSGSNPRQWPMSAEQSHLASSPDAQFSQESYDPLTHHTPLDLALENHHSFGGQQDFGTYPTNPALSSHSSRYTTAVSERDWNSNQHDTTIPLQREQREFRANWSGAKLENSTMDWSSGQMTESFPQNGFGGSLGPSFAWSPSPCLSTFNRIGPTQFLDEAAVAIQDDDYFDVESVEAESIPESNSMFEDESLRRDLDAIINLTRRSMALAISDGPGSSPSMHRCFTLAEYVPEQAANPLRNSYTQRVFAHFVFCTGPLISFLQQRIRPSFAVGSTQQAASYSCTGLWTYSLAMMALHDQGLLHSMLAMSSYHIAKLQGAATTPSLRHYSYAIKNVHRSVNSKSKRRHKVTTLAATLLLAFYEVIKADHRAWGTHLIGALQLVKEIDYSGMTAHINYLKAKHSSKVDLHNTPRNGMCPAGLLHLFFPDIDLGLVNLMRGKKITYDIYGGVVGDPQPTTKTHDLSDAIIREYQIFQDLFWYAARHDVIHALISGNPVLLNYNDKWGDCLPRAPAGDPTTALGTNDHLMLLAGRLATFIAVDRARKIRVASSRSSQVSESKAFTASPSPGPDANGQGGHRPTRSIPEPGFYGMAPRTGRNTMPRAFEPEFVPVDDPNPSTENMDLEDATAKALVEWNDIIGAFHALSTAMERGYAPVEDPNHAPVPTPFGPAITYSSFSIAALWAWYYGVLIVAYRAHPHMPAASTVAVGAAAKKTAPLANRIGRILYRFTSEFIQPNIDPSSAGSFSESCLPLFFAGVQYVDDSQRRWLMKRLREMEAVNGWAIVSLIADGCESSWLSAYNTGRGPKWEKDVDIEDESSLIVEDLNFNSAPNSHNSRNVPGNIGESIHRSQVHSDSNFTSSVNSSGNVNLTYQIYT